MRHCPLLSPFGEVSRFKCGCWEILSHEALASTQHRSAMYATLIVGSQEEFVGCFKHRHQGKHSFVQIQRLQLVKHTRRSSQNITEQKFASEIILIGWMQAMRASYPIKTIRDFVNSSTAGTGGSRIYSLHNPEYSSLRQSNFTQLHPALTV